MYKSRHSSYQSEHFDRYGTEAISHPRPNESTLELNLEATMIMVVVKENKGLK
jgi:hypothetical protein